MVCAGETAMAMMNYHDCGQPVSDAAKKCPHCGVEIRSVHKSQMAASSLLIIGVLWWVVGGDRPLCALLGIDYFPWGALGAIGLGVSLFLVTPCSDYKP
jgi:hypothetical protein